MNESELYRELGSLTKDRDRWEENIPYVSSLLTQESVKIQAKALWMLGEMGLAHPALVWDTVPDIVSFLDSPVPLLRERAVNALGRIGRGGFEVIEPFFSGLFRFAGDEEAKVRLSFIWASENIAANTPDLYEGHMPVFEKLLYDKEDRVRIEAPGDVSCHRKTQAGSCPAFPSAAAASVGDGLQPGRSGPLSGRHPGGGIKPQH